MKKRRFLLTSIALGLSILSTPMISQASLPTHVDGQQVPSLAPMLEKSLTCGGFHFCGRKSQESWWCTISGDS